MFFRRKKKLENHIEINSKFKLNDYVDFFHKDDIYFGHISNIYLDDNDNVIYDIDIAGQCPATLVGIKEEKVVRLHG
jgi:hypothetical protein